MFLSFARVGLRAGMLPPLSERLAHAIKRLADQRRGLLLTDQFAEPLVVAIRAPRRVPGERTRLPLASASLAVIIQGTRQCSFGLLFQAMLMAMQEEEKSDADESCQHGCADPDWSRKPMDVVAQKVATQSHQAGPPNPPNPFKHQKPNPLH